VLGLSFYGLIGMREFLGPDEVAKRYTVGAPRRTTAVTFLVLTAITAAGELKEIVTAIKGLLQWRTHTKDVCAMRHVAFSGQSVAPVFPDTAPLPA
jgi:hypothetical protein